MRNLLRANLFRLGKNRLFYLGCALMFAAGAYLPLYGYSQRIRGAGDFAFIDLPFLFAPVAAILAAALVPIFVGAEYSSGAMRSRIACGYRRGAIYAANLLVSFAIALALYAAFLLPCAALGIPLLGSGAAIKTAGQHALVMLMALSAITALYLMISMLCANRTYSAVACLLLVFALLLVGLSIENRLDEPETYTDVFVENGTVVNEKFANPSYLSGAKRRVYEFLDDCLPGGQLVRISNLSLERPARMMLCDLGLILLSTGCGFALFRRKGIQ